MKKKLCILTIVSICILSCLTGCANYFVVRGKNTVEPVTKRSLTCEYEYYKDETTRTKEMYSLEFINEENSFNKYTYEETTELLDSTFSKYNIDQDKESIELIESYITNNEVNIDYSVSDDMKKITLKAEYDISKLNDINNLYNMLENNGYKLEGYYILKAIEDKSIDEIKMMLEEEIKEIQCIIE